MSTKKSLQNWYQVHKTRSGNESVERSLEVNQARQKVQVLNSIVQTMQQDKESSLISDIRRVFLGRNKRADEIYKAEMTLKDAKSKLVSAESDARSKGERAYAANWASKNILDTN